MKKTEFESQIRIETELKFYKKLIKKIDKASKGKIDLKHWSFKVYDKIALLENNFKELKKRNVLAEIGPSFLEWAEDYFKDRMDSFIVKNEAFENYREFRKTQNTITVNNFKRKIKLFCELKNFEYNPDMEDYPKDEHNRFLSHKGGKVHELIYLKQNNKNLNL